MINPTLHKKAIGLICITAILWSLGGLWIKMVDWHPMAIASARSGFAIIVLAFFIKPSRFKWSFTQIGGGFALAGAMIFFVIANKFTTAANAVLIQYTAPAYIAFLSGWILNEHVKKRDWITIGWVFCGLILFFIDDLEFNHILGNISAMAAGLCVALMLISFRKQYLESPMESIFLGNLIAFLVGIPFYFNNPIPITSQWGYLAALGFFQIALPYIIFSKAIAQVTALDASLILASEPIINPLWVFLFLGEHPGIWTIIGGAIVIISVTLRSISKIKISTA